MSLVSEFAGITQAMLYWGGLLLAVFLSLAGIVLSCISLSGTWLVTGACIISALISGPEFPGWGTVVVFVIISAAGEGADILGGTYGIKKRGGSNLAGMGALVGGIAGMILGVFIPVPLIGSLIGMLAGSFLLAFIVERRRLKNSSEAADIAFGAVIGRIFVLLLKTILSMGMTIYLFGGMLLR